MENLESNKLLAELCSREKNKDEENRYEKKNFADLSGLPISWEQMKKDWDMDGLITRREAQYLRQVPDEFAKLKELFHNLEQAVWAPCVKEAERLAEYGRNIDGYYKGLEAAMEEPVDLVRLRAEAEKLAVDARGKQNAAEKITKLASGQRDACIKEKGDLNQLVCNLKENLIKEETLNDMERNIEEWYRILKEKKALKTVYQSDAKVIRTMQGNIQLVGFEYKRRNELKEYVATAECKVAEMTEWLDELCSKCGLLCGIWQALAEDMAQIGKLLDEDIPKAENVIRELDSDYSKELWRKASDTVMLFLR